MNTRNLLLTALLLTTLVFGTGLIAAQDAGDGGSTNSEKEHPGFGRRGAFPLGRGLQGFGGRGMAMPRGFGMPGGPALQELVMEATGLEAAALRDALREGDTLAGLIEAEGGDVAAFIAEATELATGRASARIAERIEALVRGEHPEGMKDGAPRGFGRRGMADTALLMAGGEVTEADLESLRRALAEGGSPAGMIEAGGGDVEAFIAGMSESFNARVDAAVAAGRLSEERAGALREGMAARLEALVHGDFSAMKDGRPWRGWQRHKDGKTVEGERGGRRGTMESASAAEAGEESGTMLALDDSYDVVRNGVRLVMNWDAAAGAFVGTIENTSDATISRVRVEVHLSSGVELGPTATVSLAPGEVMAVQLPAAGASGFDGWTPHSETGSGEHSAGDGEHGGRSGEGEGDGEHDGEGGESEAVG